MGTVLEAITLESEVSCFSFHSNFLKIQIVHVGADVLRQGFSREDLLWARWEWVGAIELNHRLVCPLVLSRVGKRD